MSISINIVPDGEAKDSVPRKEFSFLARSALNGDIMIMDHRDIDIVIKQGDKIIAFAKAEELDSAYASADRLMNQLVKDGIIERSAIQGGNVYGSLEAEMLSSKEIDQNKAALVSISNFFDADRSYLVGTSTYDQLQDDALLEPDAAESTELGQVPAAEEKGSVRSSSPFGAGQTAYDYGRYSW